MTAFRRVLGFFSLSLSLIAIATLIGGTLILLDAKHPTNLGGYHSVECTLDKVQVVQVGGCGWMVVWRDSKKEISAIASPFAMASSKAIAITRIIDYPLFVPLKCYVDPNISPMYPKLQDVEDCNVWGATMLDTRLVDHIQTDGTKYLRFGEILIACGGVVMILSIILSIFNCCCANAIEKCCGGCCNKQRSSNHYEKV